MENNHNQPATEKGKQEPQNVTADTEAQAKEKTEPLKKDVIDDQEEGDMNNGELGAGLGKQ